MVIGKGSSYGTESEIDPAWPSFESDAALAAHIAVFGATPCTLTGGDLLRTLGGGAPSGVVPRAYPVDLLEIVLDGRPPLFAVAHVIARRRLWAGEFVAAMNAAYVDGLYLGPRSHPNDGLVDTTIGKLAWQQRTMARKRAITGVHLPHPDMKMTRRAAFEHTLKDPTTVRVDGILSGPARSISITVRPDAGLVVV